MDTPSPDARLLTNAALVWYARAAVTAVLVVAALDWVGWATGVEQLTRVHSTWPPMTPWTALWLAALAAAIGLQAGQPTPGRVLAGRSVAAGVSALAVVVLAEYTTASTSTLDQMWFGEAVRTIQSTWPGRPSPQTASSVLLLAVAIAVLRVDRPWVRAVWPVCLVGGVTVPLLSLAAYLLDAQDVVAVASSTGQAVSTATALVLVFTATSVVRPDRFPLFWLLARSDWRSLIRLACILAGFPLVIALSRLTFLALTLRPQTAWALSVAVGTVVVGAVTFYFSQREQKLLIDKERDSRKRADVEMRYRILADNAVDVIVHLRGSEVAWVSPSVEAALGGSLQQWIGRDFTASVHPRDLGDLATALQRIESGESVVQRFRVRAEDGRYHWVDGHGKRFVDADGNIDGLIAALRIVDDQVEAEQRLERLARFDTLTGLVNRAEAIDRLESAIENAPTLDTHLGILFCDIDHFKEINDTWGHGVGDAVLATVATRIRGCVRRGDTVGRTGGDEILVLLPGVHSLEEAIQIAEKIRRRVAEPIHQSGNTIHATLSIGVTVAVPGEPVSAITARADAAMYKAKLDDRNNVIAIQATAQITL